MSALSRRPTLVSLTAALSLILSACPEIEEPDIDTDRSTESEAAVDADGDGHAVDVDCNDRDPDIHPGATELCNEVDDDCDGETDEDPSDGKTWYVDADGDGYGTGDGVYACHGDPDRVELDGDCDDKRADVHPNAFEIPGDDADNDCVDGDRPLLVYVVTRNGKLHAIDRVSGEVTWTLELEHEAIDVAVGPDGTIYVTDFTRGGIVRVDPETQERSSLVEEGLPRVHGLFYDLEDDKIIAVSISNMVWEVDPTTGDIELLATFRGETVDAFRRVGDDRVVLTTRALPGLWGLDRDSGEVELIADVSAPVNLISPLAGGGLALSAHSGELLSVSAVGARVQRIAQSSSITYGSCADPLGSGVIVSDHRDAVRIVDTRDGSLSELASGLGATWGCANNLPADIDGDGSINYQLGGRDCDDLDPRVGPDAADASIDGVDQNCDGVDGPDLDGDGAVAKSDGGLDCDDDNELIYPGTSGCFVRELRTCADVLQAARGASTGMHQLDHRGNGAVEPVWCDMQTLGGGWTLVGRSRPGCEGGADCVGIDYDDRGFGWLRSSGVVSADDGAYSLGARHLAPEQALFGSYAEGKAWGKHVYVHDLPGEFPASFDGDSHDLGRASTVRGECAVGGSMHRFIGVEPRGISFFMRDQGEMDVHGLGSSGFYTSYQENSCGITGMLSNWQGQIMVR